jgi:predicted RNA-binding Zn-ribbon protein involved in translation (DUF1610 family)
MTYAEFARTVAGVRVRYHHNYTTRLVAEGRRGDGTAERVVIACPACQSTEVTRLNFTRATLQGEPMHDQCDRCRFRFPEAEGLVLPMEEG